MVASLKSGADALSPNNDYSSTTMLKYSNKCILRKITNDLRKKYKIQINELTLKKRETNIMNAKEDINNR